MDVATFCPVLYLHWNYGSCLFQPLRRVFWWRYHLCYLYSVGSCNFIGDSLLCIRPLDERSFGRRIIKVQSNVMLETNVCTMRVHTPHVHATCICARNASRRYRFAQHTFHCMVSCDIRSNRYTFATHIQRLDSLPHSETYNNYRQQKSSEARMASELS